MKSKNNISEITTELLDTLYNNIEEAVILLDEKYIIKYCSPRLAEILILPNIFFINKKFDYLFFKDDYILGNYFLHLDTQQEITLNTDLRADLPSKNLNCNLRITYFKKNHLLYKYAIYIKDSTKENLIKRDLIRKTISIENLTKSRLVRAGDFKQSIFEILQVASQAIRTSRVNAWEFEAGLEAIRCIGGFDINSNKNNIDDVLQRSKFPNYFQLFKTDKIITTNNVNNDVKTIELLNSYLKPHNIGAMLDIPIRIQGRMIGVLCFEHVGSSRSWQLSEQLFGLITAQLISQVIENKQKTELANQLSSSLKQQSVIFQELEHRVNNNLNLLLSILEFNKDKGDETILQEAINKIKTIKEINGLFKNTQKTEKVSILDYFNAIIAQIEKLYGIEKIKIKKQVDNIDLTVDKAIPLGLIFHQILTNAFQKQKFNDYNVEFLFTKKSKRCNLVINIELVGKKQKTETNTDLNLINAIAKEIGASLNFIYDKGESYLLTFDL